jgi:hypothetical protein
MGLLHATSSAVLRRPCTHPHHPSPLAPPQLVSALGATTCGELFERRGLVAALFSPVALEFFLGVSLGLGEHGVGRWWQGQHAKRPAAAAFVASLARLDPPSQAPAPLRCAGATRHSELPPESEPQRKGISCERTFKAVSDPKTLHETVGAVWGWEEGVGGGPG